MTETKQETAPQELQAQESTSSTPSSPQEIAKIQKAQKKAYDERVQQEKLKLDYNKRLNETLNVEVTYYDCQAAIIENKNRLMIAFMQYETLLPKYNESTKREQARMEAEQNKVSGPSPKSSMIAV